MFNLVQILSLVCNLHNIYDVLGLNKMYVNKYRRRAEKGGEELPEG